MKTKLLKAVLPFLAFIMAAAFAFATDLKPSGDEALTNEYIFRNGQCQSVSKGCNNLSDTPCTYNVNDTEYQVYSNRIGTSCSSPMTHQP